MDFEGQYLTYEEYKVLGGTLDLTPFNILEYECRRIVDERTHNRLIGIEEIPTEVKMCMFNLINRVEVYNNSNNKDVNISSESIDGYSYSYATGTAISEIVKSKNVELTDMIMKYLYGVIVNNEHIIYNGV